MKKEILIVLGSLLAVAMLFGAVKVTTAYAQEGTPPAPFGDRKGDGHGNRHGLGEAEQAAAAKVLGMSADDLSAALKDGKTLVELADTAGVDIQDVKNAISAVQAEEMRAKIEAGIADGTISKEKGAWLLEGLDKGFLDGGPGMGFGGGRRDKDQSAKPVTP